MTNFGKIKELDFEDMVSLFAWGCIPQLGIEVPSCEKGCPDWNAGCANGCPHDKQEKAVREWLESEAE